jgi:hypothetical protein
MQQHTFLQATVRGTSPEVNYVLVTGPEERQYTLNQSIMGPLWGAVKRGDALELEVEAIPGQLTKIMSVRLLQTTAK